MPWNGVGICNHTGNRGNAGPDKAAAMRVWLAMMAERVSPGMVSRQPADCTEITLYRVNNGDTAGRLEISACAALRRSGMTIECVTGSTRIALRPRDR